MQLPRAKMKRTKTRLAAGGRGVALRRGEALEGRGFGWSYRRTRQGLYQIKLKGAHAAVWKDTCSGVLPSSSGPTRVSDCPLRCLCRRGSSSAWACTSQPAGNGSPLEKLVRAGREVQSSPCTPGLCGESAGLIPGLPLPLKKCHQLFPSPWLHLCGDKTNHTPEVPVSLLHWESRVTSAASDTWLAGV